MGASEFTYILGEVVKNGGTAIGFALFMVLIYRSANILFDRAGAYFDELTNKLRKIDDVADETNYRTKDILDEVKIIRARVLKLRKNGCKDEYKKILDELKRISALISKH